MAEPEFVTLQVEDGIGTIRLDRPKMNAINEQLHMEVRAAALEAAERDDVRAVVLYGGERVFAAGADIKAMSAAGRHGHGRPGAASCRTRSRTVAAHPQAGHRRGHRLRPRRRLRAGPLRRLPGARRRARRSASRRSCSASSRAPAARQRLARLVGPAKAKDLVFTGRHVGAEEALEIGLADAVVPDDEVYSTAVAMAAKFAAGPPLALAAAKRAIDEGLDLHAGRGPRRWRAGCSPSCSTPRTRRPACARSWRAAPARPTSPAAEPCPPEPLHHTFVCRNRP